MKYIILILALFYLSQAQLVYNLCDYLNNDTNCQTPNNCQLITENTCHAQADCDSTGLCFSRITGDVIKVTVDNYQKSCQESPSFSVNLTVGTCTNVPVFNISFVTDVTVQSSAGVNICVYPMVLISMLLINLIL